MSDNKDYFGTIVGAFVAIILIIFGFTVLFGDNSCSAPKQKPLEYGCVECKQCHGTGVISSKKFTIGLFSWGYENQRCQKCNGKGMLRIKTNY